MQESNPVARAMSLSRGGNTGEAAHLLRVRSNEAPTDLETLASLVEIATGKGQAEEALDLLQRALLLYPEAAGVRIELARRLDQKGQVDLALDTLNAAQTPELGVWALRAELLGKLKRTSEELNACRDLVTHWPDHPGLWMSYGNALKYAGDREGAVQAFRKAIKLRPTFGEAWWSLANLKTVAFSSADILAMRKALKRTDQAPDLLHLHFALGQAYEDGKQFERAFRHYAQANQIRHRNFPAELTRITPRVDAAVATFDSDLMERAQGAGHPGTGPIFIVGLQRSGSTLIEQILASHPEVEGMGELLVMEQLWASLGNESRDGSPFTAIANCSRDRLYELGQLYLERTGIYRRTDRPFFVDKLPANWLNAGFIRLILPNAKIIDARRHPLACGFSNFKQNYASGIAFAYSLETIGCFYREYTRLMHHMDAIAPGSIHRVLNETLIDDFENEVRRLLGYLGLPFSPECLAFHKTRRAINTPSAEQVRLPINSKGVDAWRSFEQWLDPLKEALGPTLHSWDEI